MSVTPLRPALTPVRPSSRAASNPQSPLVLSVAERMGGSGSASSSVSTASPYSKQDQIIHRCYIKTVGVLVEGRLTHYGATAAKGEKRKDKWFNLTIPEVDLHKADLRIYQSVSSYQPMPRSSLPAAADADTCTIPPLLVAFILDTSDLPNGQALLWNRDAGKVPIDMGLLGSTKGKGKEKERRTGIVLERWTLRASTSPTDQPSTSQLPPHTAYRLGVTHFRALHSLVRLMPAYRFSRRLRRANNGLRMGIKLWGPEGYPNSAEGLAEAWEVMERGLLGLDVGLEQLVPGEQVEPEERQTYDLPALDLFGVRYSLGVEYRSEVEFHVEDMESVLSEKFVDMEEDWFTPTVARHRMEEEARAAEAKPVRKPAASTAVMANPSPIPPRQQPASIGSFRSSLSRPVGSRLSSGTTTLGPANRPGPGSQGGDRWGALGEGLPFAGAGSALATGDSQTKEPTSPSIAQSGAAVTARRLSGHSIHPFALSSSPSTSLLRSTPPGVQQPSPVTHQRPSLPGSKPSSVGRTSSFLSQSGRSFTHAQLANMYPGSASPPVTGIMTGLGTGASPTTQSPVSPSSLSFSKQPVQRSLSGRPSYVAAGSSPFIPGSLERDATILAPSPGAPPQIIKRYSSSYSQRQGRLAGSAGSGPPLAPGSQGSSGEGTSFPGSVGQGLLRRTSTRMSSESGLRHSVERTTPGPDDDDIQAFLKTLDALPQPPLVAAQAAQASRSHLPSTSSSLSNTSGPLSPSMQASSSPNAGRAPMTRAQVNDALARMMGSFTLQSNPPVTASRSGSHSPLPQTTTPTTATSSSGNTPSVGLLTASRPLSAARRISSGDSDPPKPPPFRRQTSGPRPSSVKTGSPLARDALSGQTVEVSPRSAQVCTARSLPGSGTAPLVDDAPMPLPIAGIDVPLPPSGVLSPQTTGGTSNTSRRGPVLLRGGFGEQRGSSSKASTSSSPSHSPIRDFARLNHREARGVSQGERQAEEELGAWTGRQGRYRPMSAVAANMGAGFGPAGAESRGGSSASRTGKLERRTAPSSLGADARGQEEDEDEAEGTEGSRAYRARGRMGRVASEGEGL